MIILRIPTDARTHELGTSIVWLENDGVLYSVPKPGPFRHQTREEMLVDMKKFREITDGKKVCMVVETHPHSESPPREDRDFIAELLAEVTKAMAIITPSALGRMVANLFFLFNPPPYPTKMFVSVSDAKAWLKTCLKKGGAVPVL